MTRHFKIGTFTFDIHHPNDMIYPENFLKFETDESASKFTYTIEFVDTFEDRADQPIFYINELLVYQQGNLEERYIGSRQGCGYFAHYKETSPHSATVAYLTSFSKDLAYDTIFTSALALEKHLLDENQLLLHCAYMERNGKAILFSAPSETGKTTQANLWKKYRNTDTVNGDRALLRKFGDSWYACGWPVCGSSEICNNKDLPIEAIVMLSQAPDNTIRTLRPMQAFSQLYSQITINRWKNDAQDKATGLIEEIITQVPIYHLACNISEQAVECLESVLQDSTPDTNPFP